MTVEELMEKLKSFPPESSVELYCNQMQDVELLVFVPGNNTGYEIMSA